MKKENFWCKLGFHKWKVVDIEISKKVMYGDTPAARVKEKCAVCSKIKYTKANLVMLKKDLYNDKMWK